MRFILAIIGIALIWGGGQGVYTAAKNPDPVEISCADLANGPPSAEWVRVTDCVPNLEEAAYSGLSESDPNEVFIPLLPQGAEPEAKSVVVLASREDAMTGLFGKMSKLNAALEREDEGALEKAVNQLDQMLQPQSYEGLIQFGIDLDDDERDQLAGLSTALAADFVLLEHGESPKLWTSIGMLGLGLLLFGGFVLLLVRKSE